MFIDSLLKISAAQAVTGAAVSTSSIDLGLPGGTGTPPKREVGTGEPLGFAVTCDVAASLTTLLIEIINTTDAALTAGLIVLATQTRLQADMPAGGAMFLAIPPGAPAAGLLRFIGLRYTPTGGAATVTLSAWLTTHSLFSILAKSYAKNYIP